MASFEGSGVLGCNEQSACKVHVSELGKIGKSVNINTNKLKPLQSTRHYVVLVVYLVPTENSPRKDNQ